MKSEKIILESKLYKKNLKMHSSLWKIYLLTLIFSLLVVVGKGIGID